MYTLKNVGHPEYTFSMDSGVMSLDFHPQHPALLAVGCYDGTVKVGWAAALSSFDHPLPSTAAGCMGGGLLPSFDPLWPLPPAALP